MPEIGPMSYAEIGPMSVPRWPRSGRYWANIVWLSGLSLSATGTRRGACITGLTSLSISMWYWPGNFLEFRWSVIRRTVGTKLLSVYSAIQIA